MFNNSKSDADRADAASNIPTGKFKRAFSGGRTVAKMGGQALVYYAKRPFLDTEAKQRAQDRAFRNGARTLFHGLSLLKGTALKMAQLLSLEMDLLPEAACEELSKAYHQVPPINRALVRKAITEGLGAPPENIFNDLDLNAFAAASIGQVHRATARDGTQLAVKIQYPGIARTIENDLGLLRHVLRPVIQEDQLAAMLAELSGILNEEVDYLKEASHLSWFARHLKIEGVCTPEAIEALCAPTVLTTTKLPGVPLDQWLKSNPKQPAIDHVAEKLQQIFITGLYDLHVIHADPNPGNFIIADDLSVGLVDFGCVKRLTPDFVSHYRQLALNAAHCRNQDHYQELISVGLMPAEQPEKVREEARSACEAFSRWFCRLFADEVFNFKRHPEFIAQGKGVIQQFHQLRRHMTINPDFIFLDRTRYGLLRLFEQMGARVRFRNAYEW